MLAIAKVLIVAIALTGVAGTGVVAGVAHVPLQKAIDIHKSHLEQNSTMPVQSQHGQQNALDHLVSNQEKILSKHNVTHMPDTNETELPETDQTGYQS
jgi:hypothetical protein